MTTALASHVVPEQERRLRDQLHFEEHECGTEKEKCQSSPPSISSGS